MVGFGTWLAFATASALIAVLPGPGVANIVGYAVNSGHRTAFAAIAGAVAGNLVAMSVSLAGAGSLLEASPRAYGFLELAGAAYLLVLGLVAILRSPPSTVAGSHARVAIPAHAAFVGSVGVSALNPKSIVFFVAFVPQFISPADSYVLQAITFLITFASIVAVSDTLYALIALQVTGLLSSPRVAAWVRRAGGVVLIATGTLAATTGWAGR